VLEFALCLKERQAALGDKSLVVTAATPRQNTAAPTHQRKICIAAFTALKKVHFHHKNI
jgi:hypothetical protein